MTYEDDARAGPDRLRTLSSNTGARGGAGPRALWLLCGALGIAVAALPRSASAQTWSQRTSNTAQALTAVVYSTAVTAAAVGANAAIIVSGDGGSTWTDKNLGIATTLNAVFSNGVTIATVGNDQAGAPDWLVADSPDRGATWAVNTNVPATDEDLVDGLFVNETNAVAVESNGGTGEVILSVDRGASWTNPFDANDPINAVDSRSALVIAVGDNQGPNETIVRSVDSGVTWAAAAVVPNTNEDLFDVVVVNATTAVAVGGNGEILQSTDSGANWTNPFDAGANDLFAVASSGSFVVTVGQNGDIAYSDDGGATWVSPVSPTANDLQDVRYLTGSIALAVGNGGTIIGSTDHGLTWTAQTSTTTQNLTALAYNGLNNTLAVGANGTVLLSLNQISVSEPIPFRSKWLLVLLLVGAGLLALRRRRPAA